MRQLTLIASSFFLVLAVAAGSAEVTDDGYVELHRPSLRGEFRVIPVSREGHAEGGRIYQYKYGNGPGVLILHEVNGLTYETLQLAKDIGDRGYSVFIPLLFGDPEKESGSMLSVCRRQDFYCLSKHRSSPIVTWLRSLLPEVKKYSGGSRIAVIGMCLTGSFPIAFLDDHDVKLVVLSQPSLPFSWTPAHQRAFGLDPGVIEAALRRIKKSPVKILALRYKHDRISPPARLKAIEDVFGVKGIQYSERLYKGEKKHPHALLTSSRLDAAYQEVVKALEEELQAR